uniref:Acrosin-binding protein n=1 Tax=Crocodylus porosus TaxID=8502 RepID=A0A7M4EF43_CROPO
LSSPCPAFFTVFLQSLVLPLCGKSLPAPGTPLSDSEYQVFFSALLSSQKANMFCQIRRTQGCYDPNIIWLDQHENHGWIPEGTESPVFPCSYVPFILMKERSLVGL